MTVPSLAMVLQLLTAPAILNSGAPLGARMVSLCKYTTELLECDRSSVFVWDGSRYRARYNYGNPPEIERYFYDYSVSPGHPMVQAAEASGSYLVINDARSDPRVARIAEAAHITSMVVAAVVESDGTRLGLMTSEFNETMGTFEPFDALVTRAAAHLAHAALVQDRDHVRRVELSRAVLEIEDEAWRRVARDLHDDALQRSFAVSVRLEKLIRQTSDPEIRTELTTILDEARAASGVLRHVTTHVHPDTFQADGLVPAIRRQLYFMAENSGAKVTFRDERVDNHAEDLPTPEVHQALGRIVQQALHNVNRHASASNVSVVLGTADNGTSARITDDGKGFDPEATRADRLGLVSMTERAALVNGTVRIESAVGEGTTVSVWIPHRTPSASEATSAPS